MWLLPTLNRIEKLRTFLDSALESNTTTPGLVLVDKHDFNANKEQYELIERDLLMPEGWRYIITDSVTMGDKIRETFDLIESKWVGVLNDDHFIVTKDWDKKLLSVLDGKNFASANDRKMAPIKATTATVWSKDLLTAVGWPIYPPNLQHLFIDDVWESLGKSTGCWRVCMNVVVEHKHVLFGSGKQDDTHNAVYGAEFQNGRPSQMWDMDKAVFENFMKHNFEATVKKIIEFQDKPRHQSFNPNYDKPLEGML